jgi:imidazolonepropionase-like amidohydrolase
LSAAKILGIDDRVGSISVGKDASLIVCDGDILETESNVKLAYLQGREVDLTSRHTMLFEKYQQKYRRKPKGD